MKIIEGLGFSGAQLKGTLDEVEALTVTEVMF